MVSLCLLRGIPRLQNRETWGTQDFVWNQHSETWATRRPTARNSDLISEAAFYFSIEKCVRIRTIERECRYLNIKTLTAFTLHLVSPAHHS